VRHVLLARPQARVVCLDKLTYAGNAESLATLAGEPRFRFVKGDIGDGALVVHLMDEERIDAVVNLAAESHVDRSIAAPAVFIETNVSGTRVLLDAARERKVARFVQVGTDEVYGSVPAGRSTEEAPLAPSSPYAASKAAGDHLALAWTRTYGLPVVVTRACNNYGPWQFPEKLIPLMGVNAMRDEPLPVYGDGKQVRDWIHVEDHCAGILLALEKGRAGEVYNLSAEEERENVWVVEEVLRIIGKPRSLLRHVADRPGHDRRYALDASKARRELGFAPRRRLAEALPATVQWYRDNRTWWEHVLSGEYRRWYERQYPGLA
jgi:dTDP-glucose 4,6-dehydratase